LGMREVRMAGEEMEELGQEATDVAAVWGVALTAVHCAHCGEAHLVPEDAIPSLCPLCLQGPVTPQPAYLRQEPPEQVLAYSVQKQRLAAILDRWAQGTWFRPAELKADVLARRARRYLIPLWLVDGQVTGAWRADVGFDYQAVSYQDRYREGAGWSSREVTEGRVRWEPRVGRLGRSYENAAAPALDDHRALMGRLGDFDLEQRADYSLEAVAGGVVRVPSLDHETAWPGAHAALVRAAGEECRQAAGADHIRNFTLEAEYDDLNWTMLLLPVYATWYRDEEHTWPVLVNGQNGRVSGVRRASTRKANITSFILGVVGVLMFLLGGLLALMGAVLPPLAVLGGVILVVGLLLAVSAPIPAIGVWMFNRRST